MKGLTEAEVAEIRATAGATFVRCPGCTVLRWSVEVRETNQRLKARGLTERVLTGRESRCLSCGSLRPQTEVRLTRLGRIALDCYAASKVPAP